LEDQLSQLRIELSIAKSKTAEFEALQARVTDLVNSLADSKRLLEFERADGVKQKENLEASLEHARKEIHELSEKSLK
jgi:predicted  nucleic acid-binding Zn-ribbon protein